MSHQGLSKSSADAAMPTRQRIVLAAAVAMLSVLAFGVVIEVLSVTLPLTFQLLQQFGWYSLSLVLFMVIGRKGYRLALFAERGHIGKKLLIIWGAAAFISLIGLVHTPVYPSMYFDPVLGAMTLLLGWPVLHVLAPRFNRR